MIKWERQKMSGFLSGVGKAVSDGVNAAGRVVSRGLDAVNNAYSKAKDSEEAIIETVVSSPDILTDMIADSVVGQYWFDFRDHNVDSVNAIEGMLEDTAEELANDEDVLGFIRDYMNGFIVRMFHVIYLGWREQDAEAIGEAGGRGKIRIKSAGESDKNSIDAAKASAEAEGILAEDAGVISKLEGAGAGTSELTEDMCRLVEEYKKLCEEELVHNEDSVCTEGKVN